MEIMAAVGQSFWPILLSFVALIFWAARLEGKVAALESKNEDDSDASKAIWAKFDIMQTTLNSVLQSVSRLEGRLEGSHIERD